MFLSVNQPTDFDAGKVSYGLSENPRVQELDPAGSDES